MSAARGQLKGLYNASYGNAQLGGVSAGLLAWWRVCNAILEMAPADALRLIKNPIRIIFIGAAARSDLTALVGPWWEGNMHTAPMLSECLLL